MLYRGGRVPFPITMLHPCSKLDSGHCAPCATTLKPPWLAMVTSVSHIEHVRRAHGSAKSQLTGHKTPETNIDSLRTPKPSLHWGGLTKFGRTRVFVFGRLYVHTRTIT